MRTELGTSTTLVALLAILKLGAVYLPLNTAYQASEVDYFLRDATPRILIAASSRAVATRLASISMP